MAPRTIASGALAFLLLSFASVCHGMVETCEELQAAFGLTETQDVVVQISRSANIECANFTTMSMDSNTLRVEAIEEASNGFSRVDLSEIRFEVVNGAALVWEPAVEFRGSETQNVNGGGVFVGDDSTVRFLDNLVMTDVGVRSVADEGTDFAQDQLSGGCVYTDGYFRVDGEATFTRCEVGGGGESSPGPGGAVYVGGQGSVLFNSGVEISEVSIIDDDGNNGGGIYNLGKVNIKGDSVFHKLGAVAGGAIFNAAGAEFYFRSGVTALFTDCGAIDGIGGSLYNQGYLTFSGAALFVKSGAIYVAADGELVLSSGSVFWATGDSFNPAVIVAAGGDLKSPDSVIFFENDTADCSTVYFEQDEVCSP